MQLNIHFSASAGLAEPCASKSMRYENKVRHIQRYAAFVHNIYASWATLFSTISLSGMAPRLLAMNSPISAAAIGLLNRKPCT